MNGELLSSLPADTSLTGRTALVTGSSGGSGEAIARALAASGAEVVVSGRDAERAQGVVDALVRAGGRAPALTADLGAEPGETRTFAQRARDTLHRRHPCRQRGRLPGLPHRDRHR